MDSILGGEDVKQIIDEMKEFEEAIENCFESVKLWPKRYVKRFKRWYERRNKGKKIFDLIENQPQDLIHHLTNWDNGLKKALLRSNLLQQTCNKVSRDVRDDRKELSFKFKKEARLNPKTSALEYHEIDYTLGVEQGDTGQTSTNLETSAVTSSTANITFVDERPVDKASLHTGSEVYSRDVHNDIAENDWTLKKVLTREYPLQSFEWKVNSTWSTPLYTNGVPKIITDDANCMITRQLRFFSFLRAGIKIRVQLNGTKFHCGRVIVYFKPITWDDDLEDNFYSITCYPHFFLDASVSNSGELTIPFTHLLSYFSQESKTLFNDSINTLGSINVRVYNPLQAAEKSSQSLFGQIYVSLIDPFVHLPTHNIDNFSYGTGYMQSLESVVKKLTGGLIDSGLGLADSFTGGLVTGAGDAICNLLGVSDKPADPVSASPMVNRTVAPLSHGAGLDRSVRLGLSPTAQTNTSPDVLGATDGDFDLLKLCKIPCLLDQKEWNVTDKSGDKLFDMAVTPTYLSNPQYTADGTTRVANYTPTMMGYISRGFCLWRGTMKVKIQVIATQFHSGRLYIVYDPHGTHDVNLTDLDRNKSHNAIIMDIQEKQELVVELPNFMVKPWLRCDSFRSDASLSDISGIKNPSYLDCDAAGVFRVFVLNGLVRPDNVTDKVQINFFFYAGDNFELAVPNPVAPLSARKGPKGIQYFNSPRYPWCKNSNVTMCDYYQHIMDLYNTGADLFAQGKLIVGPTWYEAKENIRNQDTICYVYTGKQIKYYMETAEGPCKELIEKLPNFVAKGIEVTVARIDENTKAVLGDLSTVQPEVNNILVQTEKIQNSADKTYALLKDTNETVKTNQDIIKDTQTVIKSISPQVEDIQKIVNNVQNDIKPIMPQIEGVQRTVDNIQSDIKPILPQIKETITQVDLARGEIIDNKDLINKFGNETITTRNLGSQILGTAQVNKKNIESMKPQVEDTHFNTAGALTTKKCYRVDNKTTGRKEVLSYLQLADRECGLFGEEQSSESYTTTRDSEGSTVLITEGNSKSVVAPDTVSENAMNLQTLLRRFYPLWISPRIRNSNNFTIISIPVSPSFVPDETDATLTSAINRHYDIHNLAWWSRLYTYWRGSMRYKFLVNSDDSDIYVWHNPVDTKNFHVTSGFSYEHVTEQLNFATEVAVTRVQQGIEVEIPFYSSFNQLVHSHVTNKADLRSQNGTLYIAVRNQGKDINISAFVSTGDDFFLNVLRSPPIVHEPGLEAYVDGKDESTRFPDLQRSMGHTSSYMQMPGTYVLDRWNAGYFGNCDLTPYSEPVFLEKQLLSKKQQTISEGIEQGLVSDTLGVNEIVTIGEKLTAHFGGINENLEKVTNTIPSLMSFLETLKQQVPLAVKTAQEGVSSLNEVASFGKWATNTLMVGTFVMDFNDLLQEFSWIKLTKALIVFCIYLKIEFHSIISWLLQQIHSMYEGSRLKANNGDVVAEEQGFTELICDHREGTVVTMSAIATVIFCSLFGKMPDWRKIKEFVTSSIFGKEYEEQGLADSLRSVHFSVMGAKSLYSAYEFFSKWIEVFVDWIIGRECKELLMVRAFQEKSDSVLKWLDEIESLDADDAVLEALTNIDLHNKIYGLVDTGREFTRWTMSDAVPRNISCVIRDSNKKLMDLVKRINANRPGQGFRYAPFVVMFDGSSSIAKTNVMHEFTDMFRSELQIPYYNSVFPVPTTAKYLDGYTGNTIVEWDDVLQSPEQDALVAEFINWRSNADFKPNMAVAEEKGKIHFLSKVILMTTNNGGININTIRDMNAFRNRINIKFNCHLAPGWNVARVKALPEKDNNYSFMLFDAYFSDENGTNFELFQEDMSYIEAKRLTKRHFALWDIKQNNLVTDYMTTHGSLKIPKGVQIIDNGEEQSNFTDFEDSSEVYKEVYDDFTIQRDNDLSSDELDEAMMFECLFEAASILEKQKYHDLYRMQESLRRKPISNNKPNFWVICKRMFQKGCSELQNTAQLIYAKFPNLINTLGLIAAMGAGYQLFSSMWQMFSTKNDVLNMPVTKVIRAEMYEPVVKSVKQVTRAEMYEPVVKTVKNVVRAEGLEQGCDDLEAIELGRSKIHPLLFSFGWSKGANPVQLQGISVGGKIVMLPFHFFRKAVKGDVFHFIRGNDKIEVEFVPQRLFRIRDKDCALYYVGPQFDSRRCILNCFVKERDLSRLCKNIPAVLVGTTPKGTLMEKGCRAVGEQIIKYKGSDAGAEEFVQVGWKYDIDTVRGECGSILLACSKNLPPPAKIVGMHTAGFTNCRGGFSIVITREMVEETIHKVKHVFGEQVYNAPMPHEVNKDPKVFEEQAGPKPEGAFTYWGTMNKNLCPSQPRTTCFKQTPFAGRYFTIKHKPAMLVEGNGISPLKQALGKYGKLTKPFQRKHILAVRADILNELSMFSSDLMPERTSLNVAIFGQDGTRYCERLNMKSSPGWPYQCLPNARGESGKAYLFDIENSRIKDDLLKKNLMEREKYARKGERVPSIWRDCMKDELRSIEKVDAGKTRLFTIAPVDYTILVRKYFLAFEQMFYKNHSKFFSAVGINPESFEWTIAYNRLRAYGNKCCAGDFSTYDGTLMADLMYEVGEIIDDWYKLQGEDDVNATNARRVLIDEMIHTVQLVNNCVYKTHQGNPSGNPLTVIINTIVNAMYMRLSWLEIMSEKCPKYATMDDYHKFVIEEIYGDDNRLVIRDEVIHLYNQLTLTENLAKHNIIYTDESKNKTLVPYKELEKTTFLKRAYRFDEEVGKEIILPVIEEATIGKIMNWYRDSDDIGEQLRANMRAALGFSFFHGRDFYDNLAVMYQKLMRQNSFMPICATYDEQLDRFLSMVHGTDDGTYENFVELGF